MKFRNLAFFYLILDAILIAISSAFGAVALLNSQVAFICSTLILFASYFGYKSRVENKSVNYQLSEQELELFEDDIDDQTQELDTQDSNNKNDKKSAKFRKIDILGAFKPLRLLSYFILIIAFFVLLRHGILEPIAFLAGLALMPLGVFCAGVFYGRK
ncbi:MAG: hypothetical protein J6I71_01000 [Campylobacter sp.]|uniref:hypothetical protein n=1 Tax=Campylobacter sp. TaxID=205 RepID=UPI001B7BA1AD|nr:hypothetical protein [Campylobacter sp.]MBP3675031.1 hypothetical protein [Campylobacter sp.]